MRARRTDSLSRPDVQVLSRHGSLGAMAADRANATSKIRTANSSIGMPVIGKNRTGFPSWFRRASKAACPIAVPLAMIVTQMVGGLKSGMGYCGCPGVPDLQQKARFVRISSAGLRESHVHDVSSHAKRRITRSNREEPALPSARPNLCARGGLPSSGSASHL